MEDDKKKSKRRTRSPAIIAPITAGERLVDDDDGVTPGDRGEYEDEVVEAADKDVDRNEDATAVSG